MPHKSATRTHWAAYELEIIQNGTLTECIELLRNDRMPSAIARVWRRYHPTYGRGPAARRRRIERQPGPRWTAGDLQLLRDHKDLPARELRGLLTLPKTVWSVNLKRRQLKLTRNPIGRRAFKPDGYPGTDWSKPIRRIALDLGVSWRTAKKLQQLALEGGVQ